MVIAPFTGASFNPARSFGPAVASGFLETLGLSFVGPFIGGAAAGAAAYRLDTKNREGVPEQA
jgi:glycerol uptake facilitator-like aquaporin